MKTLLKKILFRWQFTHKITDSIYNIFSHLKFFVEWRIAGRHHDLIMRPNEKVRGGLRDLINDLPDGISMIEIGSYRGESASIFLASNKIKHIFCVDPWSPFYDPNDAAAFTDMQKVESQFEARFCNDNRVSKEKGTIDDFINKYTNMPKVDFVYIDGCHTEEATAHDITMSLERIHPTFAIAGHDYDLQGVQNAVSKTLTMPDKTYADTSWIKFL